MVKGIFKYYGGKARLAPWIISHFPKHHCYTEPFCGSARILFAKQPSPIEVINDLDRGVTCTFKCARDCPELLADMIRLTPYSREEFKQCVDAARLGFSDNDIEAARQFLTIIEQGFFGIPLIGRQSFRTDGPRNNSTSHFAQLPDIIIATAARLQNVIIECKNAEFILNYYDSPDTLHYCDPPYHPETGDCKYYLHNATTNDLAKLCHTLSQLKGMVALSAYPHIDFDNNLPGFTRIDKLHSASSAAPTSNNSTRIESLYLNPALISKLKQSQQLDLFI